MGRTLGEPVLRVEILVYLECQILIVSILHSVFHVQQQRSKKKNARCAPHKLTLMTQIGLVIITVAAPKWVV